MTVYDLNRDQLVELKQHYLTEQMDARGESPSWGELADADDIISDEEIYNEYAGYEFGSDDFSSSAGQEYFRLDLGDCIGSRDDIASDLREIADKIEDGYYSGLEDCGTSWGIEKIE